MKVQFEKWCEQNNMTEDTRQLFDEGILCYKIGAYRASFIMSYLGLQSELRNRIIISQNKPDYINDKYWKQIKREVQDDSIWDQSVFDAVNRSKPDNVFLIGDDIRKQYDYWRAIRNDCAHAKNNIISYPHVESFWLFIQSNYNKLVINGGKEGIIEKIREHYDVRYTEPGRDVGYIIDSISTSVKKEEIEDVISEIHNLFKNKMNLYDVFSREKNTSKIWEGIIFSKEDVLRKSMISYVKSDKYLFANFIENYPELLDSFISDSKFSRLIWTDWIDTLLSYTDEVGWICIEKFLKQNKIPDNELDNFIKLIKSKTRKPPETCVEILKQYNYFSLMKFDVLENYDFTSWWRNRANTNWDTIKYLIEVVGLEEKDIIDLNKLYTKMYFGSLYDGLNSILEKNIEFREKYIKVLNDNDIDLPSQLVEEEIEESIS